MLSVGRENLCAQQEAVVVGVMIKGQSRKAREHRPATDAERSVHKMAGVKQTNSRNGDPAFSRNSLDPIWSQS
jgi:hypothetical protein